MYTKAITAQLILNEKENAMKCKQLGRRVKNFGDGPLAPWRPWNRPAISSFRKIDRSLWGTNLLGVARS